MSRSPYMQHRNEVGAMCVPMSPEVKEDMRKTAQSWADSLAPEQTGAPMTSPDQAPELLPQVSLPRWWLEQARDQLFAIRNLPSGYVGNWIFLFREQLKDALEARPSPPAGGDAGQRLKEIADTLLGEAFCADWHDDPDVGVRETQRIHKLFVERINEFVCKEIRCAHPIANESGRSPIRS